MMRAATGYEPPMPDDDRDLPTTDHPLHGEPRKSGLPALVVVGFIVAFVAVTLLMIYLTRNTA